MGPLFIQARSASKGIRAASSNRAGHSWLRPLFLTRFSLQHEVHESPGNSRTVAVGSSLPGLLLPASRQAVLDSLSRRSRADNVVSTSSNDGGSVRYMSRIAVKSRCSEGSRSSLGNRRNEPGRAVS